MVVCIALGVSDVSKGFLPALIYPGNRVTWKVLEEYSWSPTIIQSGSFLCTAAIPYSRTSMPISSPAASGLTAYLM